MPKSILAAAASEVLLSIYVLQFYAFIFRAITPDDFNPASHSLFLVFKPQAPLLDVHQASLLNVSQPSLALEFISASMVYFVAETSASALGAAEV